MKLEIALKRINELMSRFVAQIKGEASMSRTDLNKAAETILIPLLNEIYGWDLENVNYSEDNPNYPGIDLADKAAKICVQVTATRTLDKVKHTLNEFIKHEQYLIYDQLIVLVLQDKQRSYSDEAIQKIVEDKFNFDADDIWDYQNLLREISSFQIERVSRAQEILEANFGGDQQAKLLTAVELRQDIRWRETCRDLLEHWKGLTTNALTKRDGVRFQLDDIFVPLGVVERQKRPRHAYSDGSPEQGSELYDEKVTPISQDDFFEQVLRQGQSQYSQGKRIAIIGEPGAGKTTQLQKIGDWILEETGGVPIWISLSALGEKSLRGYLSHDWLQTAISDLDVSQHHREDLAQLLKTGNVWLLLDGVDEMTVADALHHVAIQMRDKLLQNVRVVLTCRLNVWDAGKNALDDFDVYRNLDFEYPTEVHQFIDKWFWDKPDLQQQLKDALEQPGKERIRDMIKNPLRLTLLCYSWHIRRGELPETKAGLYEWFVDTFYDWNQGKVPVKLNSAKRRELNQALGELAREAIDQDSSRFRLSERFIADFLGDVDDEDSLFYLALQLGWLNCIGVAAENQFKKVYAFFHPTFQEYFAALAIDDWDYFLPREHKDKPVKEKKYRIFDLQWKEVILLWIGSAIEKQKAELVDRLVEFRSDQNDFYQFQANFLAVACVSEYVQYPDTKTIIKWFVEQAFNEKSFDSPASRTARHLLPKVNKTLVTPELLALAKVTSDPLIQRMLIWGIGRVSTGDEKAIEYLLSFICFGDQSSDSYSCDGNHWQAIESLGEIGSRDPQVIESLVKLYSSHSVDSHTRNLAAISLSKLGFKDIPEIAKQVIKIKDREKLEIQKIQKNISKHANNPLDLIELICDDLEESGKRVEASIKFRESKQIGSAMLIQLLHLLCNPSDHLSGFLASQILEELAYTKEQLVIIVSTLSSKLNPLVRKDDFELYWFCYGILWNCAQSMSYPDFCKAWHNS